MTKPHLKTFIIERPMPGCGAQSEEASLAMECESKKVLDALRNEGRTTEWDTSYLCCDVCYCV